MKKVIFGLALLAATSMTTFAQTPNNNACCNVPQTECVPDSFCNVPCDPCGLPLDLALQGLNLTTEQNNKLVDLQSSFKKQQKVAKEGRKCGSDSIKNDRQKPTKEQVQAHRKAMREKKAESRKNYLAGVKGILTPDQYVTYLENVYVYQAPNQGKAGKPGKMDKAGRKGHGQKGDRGNKK